MGNKPTPYVQFENPLTPPPPPPPNPAGVNPNQLPHNPFLNPYGYKENLGAQNYFNKNPSNEKNRIYIARNCFGTYITKEYTPALSFNRIPQNEFEQEMKKINDCVSSFRYIKLLYFLMILMAIISMVILIVGISLNPEFSMGEVTMKYLSENFDYFDDQNIAYNVLTGLGLVSMLITVMIFTMAVICTLKKYEFNLGKHFNEINRDNYLTRNVYWKIGGFCRFIQLDILPIQPEFFWFLQTKNGQEIEFRNIKEVVDLQKK